MTDHEAVKVEYRDETSYVYCPCRAIEGYWLTCTSDGRNDADGYCLKCWSCGRVITADGVVLTQVEVRN